MLWKNFVRSEEFLSADAIEIIDEDGKDIDSIHDNTEVVYFRTTGGLLEATVR